MIMIPDKLLISGRDFRGVHLIVRHEFSNEPLSPVD